jgi:MOSC domain-containing protein YiiM
VEACKPANFTSRPGIITSVIMASHPARIRSCKFKENYKGQITFFAWETYEAICRELGVRDKSASAFRRNVITIGANLNELIGQEFQIQGVSFRGTEECRPCYWMEQAFAPGANEFLKGRGGLRAVILSNGILRAGVR